MSIRAMSTVWELELPDSDKIVLLALADCANDEGHCWPSVASLVRKCSKSERTIQGSIKRLVDEGHITRREVPGKGCNYTIHPHRTRITPPAESAPRKECAPQGTAGTPAAAADKPSRTINTEAKASLNRVIESWNEECGWSKLHKVRSLDNSRKQQLRLRINAHGIEMMLEAVKRAHRSPFLRGEVGDGRKADINIILQPKTLSRVLEGFYGEDAYRPAITIPEQIAELEHQAAFFDRIDQKTDADECRRRIELLRAPPDPVIANKVISIVGGSAREKSVGRVAAR